MCRQGGPETIVHRMAKRFLYLSQFGSFVTGFKGSEWKQRKVPLDSRKVEGWQHGEVIERTEAQCGLGSLNDSHTNQFYEW